MEGLGYDPHGIKRLILLIIIMSLKMCLNKLLELVLKKILELNKS